MNHARVVAAIAAATLLIAFTACRSDGPISKDASSAEQVHPPSPRAELLSRPLYTFDEDDVATYLPIAREIEPNLPQRVIHLGRKNIGQPYDIFLLGEFPFELHDPQPIYCLSRSDCLVFSEHMYAMALTRDWWSFLRALQHIRYRDGVISMVTRNHYTVADWNPNNAWLFEDMTPLLGAGEACVPLHQVCRRTRFFKQFGIGQDIPDQPVTDTFIPTAHVPDILAELRAGDFVNIIRGHESSQYAGHTGLIAIADDGTVNFLHSARPVVREEPLLDYLASDKHSLGIKILRLHPDAEQRMANRIANTPGATEVSATSLHRALEQSPLMSTEAPDGYASNWKQAMQIQAYQLTTDTQPDAEFQATVSAVENEVAQSLGIPADQRAFGVIDLTGNRLALINADQIFYGASVPKICIVLAYLDQHPEYADNMPADIERELELVIKRSDNDLAAKYSRLVGLDNIQELLQSKRYQFYDADHGGGLWCGKHYGQAEPRVCDPVGDHSHAATVRQCLRYYLMLEQGLLVNAAVSARLKQIFAAPELEYIDSKFVRGLAGRDVDILRKSGTWEDWHLDTARVINGKHLYLITGMTHHPKGAEYLAQMAAAIDDLICGD